MSTPRKVKPRRAQPRFSLGIVAAVAVTAVVIVVSLCVIALTLLGPLGGRVEDQVASPVPPPAEPEPGPAAWSLPPRQWEPIPAGDTGSPLYAAQEHLLYGEPPPALEGCLEPATVTTVAEWRSAVRTQWVCVHLSWTPVLHQMGWSTTMPSVHFFEGEGGDSACGYLAAPAFYCSAGVGSVHFGARHFDMARLWDLSINEMVNHEYGHHLQNQAGITRAKTEVMDDPSTERRSELQATCWSAAMTYRNEAVVFSQEQYDSWMERLATMRADSVHGSRESLQHWGTRGLYAETLNECNTWTAPEEAVS